MKTLINLGIIGLVVMYVFDRETYLRLENPVVHVIHYLLFAYLVWILFSDLLKGLKRRLGEKFGLTFKRFKRKINHLKHKATS